MLFAEGVGAEEIDQRSGENSIDFRCPRRQHRAPVEAGDDWHDEAVARHGGEVVKLSHHRDVKRIKENFLMCFTKRSLNRSLAIILPAAGEAHFAPVTPQMPGASGEQYLCTVVAIEQCDKNGRGASTFEQPRRRFPIAALLNASNEWIKRYR
jgi:hypothetical protein